MKNSKNLSLFGRTGKLQRLFLIALFSVLAIGAYAQSKTVSGTVVDQTGEPIIGANVVVKGTTNGIITDLDGRFTLSNVPDKGTISISFIGYQDQEISVAGKTNLQVTLQEDNAMLDEVVVVGYGVQKKSDVTGAMARVGEKELKAMPVKNALEGMQRDIADMGLQGRIFAGRHGFPAVAEKEVGQAHAAQLDGIKIAVALRIAHDQFRTAAAYVDEQAQFVAAFQPAGHAEINQAGFLLSRHDGEVDARPFPHPEDKILTVVCVAHGGRGNGDNLRRFVHRAHFGQPAQNADGSAHGLFLKAVMHESALTEAHHVLDLIQNRGRSVRMNTDNQQPEGIAAQIDDADIPFRRRDYPA